MDRGPRRRHQAIWGTAGGSSGVSGSITSSAAQCNPLAAFGGQHVSLQRRLLTPSGRHVHGALAVSINGGCAPFGLSVEYHLSIESAPAQATSSSSTAR